MVIPRVISWPKLIGAFSAALGVALSLKASEFVFGMMEDLDTVHGYVWLVAVVGSGASLGIGFAVYSGREWARRTLIGLTGVAIALGIVYAYFAVTRSITGLGQFEPQVFVWTRMVFFGEALRLVSPPVFFLLVLLHPDIVRSFRHAATPPI